MRKRKREEEREGEGRIERQNLASTLIKFKVTNGDILFENDSLVTLIGDQCPLLFLHTIRGGTLFQILES